MNKCQLTIIVFSIIGHSLFSQIKTSSFKNYELVTLDQSAEFWFESEQMKDKYLIKVLLPDSYFDSKTKEYPIVYITDADRYFGMASGLVYTQLYREDVEVILVGIGYGSISLNSKKRDRDFAPTSIKQPNHGVTAFTKFLGDELIPRIESDFRVSRSNRTIVGWSKGATFVLNALFNSSELFNNYIALSARLDYPGWSITKIENEFSIVNSSLTCKLFYSMGTNDKRYKTFLGFVKNLKDRNYEGLVFKDELLLDKYHDGIGFSEGLGKGLEFVFDVDK